MKTRRTIAQITLEREGFSLIELTTAMFILVVGLFGVFHLFHFGLDRLRTIDEAAIAMQAVQNELEVVQSMPFQELREGEHAFTTTDPALERLVRATGTITISSVSENSALKKVDISILWITEKGRRAERSITTLIGEKGP